MQGFKWNSQSRQICLYISLPILLPPLSPPTYNFLFFLPIIKLSFPNSGCQSDYFIIMLHINLRMIFKFLQVYLHFKKEVLNTNHSANGRGAGSISLPTTTPFPLFKNVISTLGFRYKVYEISPTASSYCFSPLLKAKFQRILEAPNPGGLGLETADFWINCWMAQASSRLADEAAGPEAWSPGLLPWENCFFRVV